MLVVLFTCSLVFFFTYSLILQIRSKLFPPATSRENQALLGLNCATGLRSLMKPWMASPKGCHMIHILINIYATYHVLWAWFRDRNVHLRWLGCHYLCWADTIRKHHLTAISLVDWNSWNTSINLHNTTKGQLTKVRLSNMTLQLVKGFLLLTTVTCTTKITILFPWHVPFKTTFPHNSTKSSFPPWKLTVKLQTRNIFL